MHNLDIVIDIASLLAGRRPNNGAYYTIAIDGRGASGKSTFAAWLQGGLRGFALLHGDDYFEAHDDPITWGDFNEDRLDNQVLSVLRAGERSVTFRPYDFARRCPAAEQTITIDDGLIFERWFAMALAVPWDRTVWVETPATICLHRGLARDGAAALGERAVLAWRNVWQPRESAYIEATAPEKSADIVVDGTVEFAQQVYLPG